ncbi:MAG: major capsid protein [Arthrobacter sp.]|jgi:hypothetical protein|nr:major capsid protein [Arthrobacter sp.]
MALELTDLYQSPAELTQYVRQALADQPQNRFALAAFLPDTQIDDIDFRASVGGGGLARTASFRAYDTESPISGRQSVAKIQGELPPISVKRRLSEYDRLKMRKLDAGIQDAIFNDAVELAREIQARAEVARGELLQTGKVTIAENGLTLTADFGRDADLTQTAATKWNANGDVFDDLDTWRELYSRKGNGNPGTIIVSRQIISAVVRNEKVREQVYGASDTSSRIVTMEALNSVLGALGLPTFSVYEAQVANAAGVATPILNPNKVLFLPDDSLKIGETLWGTTAEALDPKYAIESTEAPGIVVGNYSDSDPVANWTKASAIMLPVAPNTNLTLAATVL